MMQFKLVDLLLVTTAICCDLQAMRIVGKYDIAFALVAICHIMVLGPLINSILNGETLREHSFSYWFAAGGVFAITLIGAASWFAE